MTETLTTEQVEDAPEFVAHFKSGRPLPHPLFDYWTSLDGKTGELGYQWSDKPHRHVFDLLNEVVHLRTELLALRKRVGGLEGVLTSSNRIIETLPADHIERAKEAMRKEFRGSGRSWWVSHARFINWIEAVRAALPTPKEPS